VGHADLREADTWKPRASPMASRSIGSRNPASTCGIGRLGDGIDVVVVGRVELGELFGDERVDEAEAAPVPA
jgi:hypothetical protein